MLRVLVLKLDTTQEQSDRLRYASEVYGQYTGLAQGGYEPRAEYAGIEVKVKEQADLALKLVYDRHKQLFRDNKGFCYARDNAILEKGRLILPGILEEPIECTQMLAKAVPMAQRGNARMPLVIFWEGYWKCVVV